MRNIPHAILFTYVRLDEFGEVAPANDVFELPVWTTHGDDASVFRAFDHRSNPESCLRVLVVTNADQPFNQRAVPAAARYQRTP